jgi:hypothetical protein
MLIVERSRVEYLELRPGPVCLSFNLCSATLSKEFCVPLLGSMQNSESSPNC